MYLFFNKFIFNYINKILLNKILFNNMYSFIFLIISCNNIPQYLQMKEISQMYYDLFANHIKYFYIELKPDLNEELIEDGNHIYIKGYESILPGILTKTQKALNYINQKYEFKYVIRTNLSTFWNLNNLLEFEKKMPTSFFGGFLPFKTFVSGTGIIMSNNVSKYITPLININSSTHDDVYISSLFPTREFVITDIENYNYIIEFLCSDDNNKISESSKNILYYRIKNANRDNDIKMFYLLINKLYKIN